MNTFKKLLSILLVLATLLSVGGPLALADNEPFVVEPLEEPEAEMQPAETAPPAPVETGDEPSVDEPAPAETDSPMPLEPSAEDESESQAAEAEDAVTQEEGPKQWPWTTPGNTASSILAGGKVLLAGERYYYNEGDGLWLSYGGADEIKLTTDNAENLNLADDWLYYTVSAGDVRRIPADGGAVETIYAFGSYIKQLYVMGDELRFLSWGTVYSYDMQTGILETVEDTIGAAGLIPTPYGNLYLSGEARSYTLWVGTASVLSGIEHCHTDGDWLVVEQGGSTRQIALSALFDGSSSLKDYSLHNEEATSNGLSDEQQLANEAAFLESDVYAEFQENLAEPVWQTDDTAAPETRYEYADDGSIYMVSTASAAAANASSNIAYTAASQATGETLNIVKRARQMAEVLWSPLYWRYAWGGDDSSYVSSHRGGDVKAESGRVTKGYFDAGEIYKGIPYSQAVSTGYVGWSLTIDSFVSAVNDSSSKFYSGYSYYSRTAPYYGSDCSGFVSWAWDLPYRCTCTSMLKYSDRITNDVQNLKLGDSLNNPNSHVVLVTDIGYDSYGNIISVEITEQTPCKMRVSCYGEVIPGKVYDYTGKLSGINSYFSSGYSIYRRNCSRSIGFTASSAVPLTESGYAPAPHIAVAVNDAGSAKVITLTHPVSSARIYYTIDGSQATEKNTPYVGPFEITSSATIRAIAVCGEPYSGSSELKYSVTVSRAQKPFVVLMEGDIQDQYVSSGSLVNVVNEAGDKVYYTTDGSAPSRLSTLASATGIKVTKDMTLKAVAYSDKDLISEAVTLQVKVGTFHDITAKVTGTGGYIVTPDGQTGFLHGTKAKFEITPVENYKVADVKIDGVSKGAISSYTFENITKAHTITASFAVDLPFKDLTTNGKNHWATENIAYAYSRNLFAGTTSTTFSPNQTMTRGMFIAVLGRFAGNGEWTDLNKWSGTLGVTNASRINIRNATTTEDGVSAIIARTGARTNERIKVLDRVFGNETVDGALWYKVSYDGKTGYMRATNNTTENKTLLYVYNGAFTDLPDGQYYTGYSQWAYIYGIMNGVTSTTFCPNNNISRQDICVLMYQYLTRYMGKSLSTTATAFKDDGKISGYARNAVYAMKNIGVVNGYTDGTFRPTGQATRAEVATMFANLSTWMSTH